MLACLTLDSVQQEKVEDVLQHLRKKSVRITETRRAVLSYLVKSQEHPSADAIYQDLKPAFPNMSLATVYNNLKVLIEEGFVSEIKVRNDTTTYFDFMGHDHLNLICESFDSLHNFLFFHLLGYFHHLEPYHNNIRVTHFFPYHHEP